MSEALPPPAPPAPVAQPARVAPTWIGGVLAGGGLLAVIAGFLQYEKLAWGQGSYSFTGLGADTSTGQAAAIDFTPGGAGKIILVAGAIALVLGILTVLRQGRIWVGIVAVVAGVVGLILGIAAIGAASTDATGLTRVVDAEVTGSIGIGAILGTAGSVVALVAGILAIAVRRPKTQVVETPAAPPAGPVDGELAS